MQIIRENLLNEFLGFASAGDGVVIGPPGVGKTHILRELCVLLSKRDIPYLYIPIDKLYVESKSEFKEELGIKGDFIDYLKSQISDNAGILLIDAFDAARSEKKQKFFLDLIRRVTKELHGIWSVVVSVRTYDAKKSTDLMDLFPSFGGSLPSSKYQMAGIDCRHFSIPKLSDDELMAAIESISGLYDIYSKGSHDFKELLRIPFNLWLVENILSINPNISYLSSASSEVQLLELLWKQRITDGTLGESRSVLLTKITREMVNQYALSVRKEDVYLFDAERAWDSLLDSELLVYTSKSGQRIAFSHNILFDYAVSTLLIEDDPDKVIEFVQEDLSRIFFLRPSLNYYFVRLWYTFSATFWDIFWRISPSSDIHLRLFLRLIPTGVIANEAREIEQLYPLLDSLKQMDPFTNEVVRYLLQSLRAFEIERDELWVQFLDQAVDNLNRDFIWDFTTAISNILKRAEENDNETVQQTCGRVSRRLLEWIWKCREEEEADWADRIGSRAVILVAKTYGFDPEKSNSLLEKVLDLIKEDNFPIRYLYGLIDELDKIWPNDPEFVASIYLAIFGHKETSEESTHIGGFVLRLTSTRRQDYEMCQYQLVQHFPDFLRAVPQVATRTAVECLNHYTIEEHIISYLRDGVELDDVIEEFQFRGKSSSYIPDGSYIWGESPWQKGDAIDMANELFTFIGELASPDAKSSELELLLDIFRDYANVAFLWRRLLSIATQTPKVFAKPLVDLCVARPIQVGSETVRELGEFLEAAAYELEGDQLYQVEKSILALPRDETDSQDLEFLERRRDRLLARIPMYLLKTTEARKIREIMIKANKIPPNEPLARIKTWSEPFSKERWLEELGADLSRPENQELQKLSALLDKFASEWQNKVPSEDVIKSILPVAEKLFMALNQDNDADQAVLDSAWTELASCAETMCRGANDPESREFQFCREVLIRCADHESPEPNAMYDSQFDHPFWSPAPRNEAAQGLPWLAATKPDLEILETIDKLILDEVPSVRFLVTTELFRLFTKTPTNFWCLAENVAQHEQNKVVQQALCRTLDYVVTSDEARTTKVLDILINKPNFFEDDFDPRSPFISIVMWLAIVRENEWAIKTANLLLEQPTRFAKLLGNATFELLDKYVKPQNLDMSSDVEIIDRAIDWLNKAIDVSAKSIRELQSLPELKQDEKLQSEIRDLYNVPNEIVMRIYFNLDFREKQRDKGKGPISDEQRNEFYFKVKPLLKKILNISSNKKICIIPAYTAHHFMQLLNDVLKYDPKDVLHMAADVVESSEPAGYNLDSISVSETVKLVEAVLADHRDEVQNDDSLHDLIIILDIFIESGWPDALRLVWRLDEIFR